MFRLLALSAIVALLATGVAAAPRWHQLHGYTFESYVRDFNKPYAEGSSEWEMRKAIFEDRIGNILKHNSANASWKKGVNQFTDYREEEFGRLLGYRRSGRKEHGTAMYQAPRESVDLPPAVDWRKMGVVTAVKDQGHCGSCWAFATTANLESYFALATGELYNLAPQQLVSCSPNSHQCGGWGGCAGSTSEVAMAYVIQHGMTEEYIYPYQSYWGDSNGTCYYNNSHAHGATPAVMNITGYVKLPENDAQAIMQHLATTGPLAVNVAASPWHDYEEGIFDGCSYDDVDINHVVQLVGYGSENGEDFWLVRNSWTPRWGEKGYIRLKRNAETKCGTDHEPHDGTGCLPGPSEVKVCGTCGVVYDASYPTGAKQA